MGKQETDWITVEDAVAKLGVDVAAMEALVKAGEIRHKARSKDGRLQHYVENSKLLLRLRKNRKNVFEVAGSFFGQSVVAIGSTIAAHQVIQAYLSPRPESRLINLTPSADENFNFQLGRSDQEIEGLANLLRTAARYQAIRREADELLEIVSRLVEPVSPSSRELFVAKPLAATNSRNVEEFVENSIFGNYRLMLSPSFVRSNTVTIGISDVEAQIENHGVSESGALKPSIMSRDLFSAIQQVSRQAHFDLGRCSELSSEIVNVSRLLSELRLYDGFSWGGVEV